MYTIGLGLTLLGLIGIMLNDDKIKRLSFLILPGLLIWGLGLGQSSTSMAALFSEAFKDLLFLGGASLVFRSISHTTYKIPLAILGIIISLGLHHYLKIDDSSLKPLTEESISSLDQNGELLVELSDIESKDRWERWISAQGWTTRRAFYPQDGERTDLDDYYLVDIPENEVVQLQNIISHIQASGMSDWIEPNEVITLDIMPAKTIPILNKQLGVNDPQVNQQWAMSVLEIDKYYQQLENLAPKKKVLLAILDTGVDAKHEDLKDNFVSISKKHDDDPKGHGTHCAGIAGAVTNNGVGVASLARSGAFFDITSIKVLKAGGSGTQQDIIKGMITAVDKGADVLSMSLGGFSNQSRQKAYSQAVKYATDKGAIVIAAAGNSNRDAAGYTPVNAIGTIGVSAIDEEKQRADFSNRVGRIEMAVAAPGVGIYSTKPNNHYDAHNGTSMATPFVSGLVAVMKSIKPDLTNKEAFKLLHNTGVPTKDTANTGKLIQPAAVIIQLKQQGI